MQPSLLAPSIPDRQTNPNPPPAMVSARDLRLDFFRGLALWFIFIDHIPSSRIAELTFRNFGFSDATEIFVFISGYTAALVYGAALAQRGAVMMTMQVLKRCWQLYAAHILLFVFFVAQITWVAARFNQASFIDELNIAEFYDDPQRSLLRALLLHYRPVNLDVLPLYMALLAALPVMLLLLRQSRLLLFGLSAALWLAVQTWQWAWPVYEGGDTWLFNPLGWQFLFVIGIVCASVRDQDPVWLRWHRRVAVLAVLMLLFALVVTTTWRYESLNAWTDEWIGPWLYPIDKNNLGPARLLHFLAVAWLVAHLVRDNSRLLSWRLARPAIICGQQSLVIFCVSISLSFIAWFALVQLGRGPLMQIAVVVGGLALMTAIAWQLNWYRQRSRQRPRPVRIPETP